MAKIQHAVISGAGSGIGQAIAQELYRQGVNLTLLDLHLNSASVTGQDVQHDKNKRLQPYELDIRSSRLVSEAVDDGVANLGSIDFAINCAGINIAAPFEQASSEDFSDVVDINLKGSRHFAAAVLPHMQAGAQLALIASMGGLVANYAYSAYSASKFAVTGLAEVLRMEYAPKGIGVSLICPPEVPTPMVEQEIQNMHPVQRELKDVAGSVTLEELVPYILEQSWQRRRFMIIPGRRARYTYFLSRFLPQSWMQSYTDKIIRKVLKTNDLY